jgi:hypothetical protein
MNATTTTTIGGERRELVFGHRYVLAHRNGAAHEVILSGRRRNGDLIIANGNGSDEDATVRVADVVSLTPVPDAVADVESDAGQAALETAYQVARTARRMSVRSLDEGRPVRRSASSMLESLGTEAGVLGVLDELVSGARHQTKRERMRDLAIAGTAAAKLEVEHHPDAVQTTRERMAEVRAELCRKCGVARADHPTKGHRFSESGAGDDPTWWCSCGHRSRAFHEASVGESPEPILAALRDGELVVDGTAIVPAATEKPARSPRKAAAVSEPVSAPARHKNRLWRCPVCKVRTRLETCPRDATPAPVGKRAVAS